MPPSFGSVGNGWGDFFRRLVSRAPTVPKRVIPAAIELANSRLALEPDHGEDGQAGPGTRVVQRERDFALKLDGPNPPAAGAAIQIYVVKRWEGRELCLKPDGTGHSGWAPADGIVPVALAHDFFTNRILADPKDAFSLLMRGVIWADKKDFDKAIAEFTGAIRLEPEFLLALLHRGRTWLNIKRTDEAIADLTEAIRLDPTNVAAYCSRAFAWNVRNDPEKAFADYNEAIRIDPLDASARYLPRLSQVRMG